ncbi:MAG: MFS transporter [Dehalococcoidia bacterium]
MRHPGRAFRRGLLRGLIARLPSRALAPAAAAPLAGGVGTAFVSAGAPPLAPPPATGGDVPVVDVAPPRRHGRLGRPRSIRTFEALNARPFRWFFVSMMGQFSAMHMQMVVTPYLVYELTGSYAALGAMSLGNAIPGVLLGFFGGVVADRAPKKLVVQIGQAINALFTLGLALLALAGELRFEHLFIASAGQGAVFAIMGPARQALIAEIVGPARLTNAVALNMSGMNVTRMGVPALGGLLIAVISPAGVYFVMTAMMIVSIVGLLPVRAYVPADGEVGLEPDRSQTARGIAAGLRDIADGLRYVRREPQISALLAVNFFIVLLSMPYMQMMAGFVKDVLGAGPGQLGLLLSITGVGSLAGSLAIASMPNRGRGRVYLLSSLLLGAALIVFAASSWLWLTALVMIVIGVGQAGRMSLSNVLLMSYTRRAYQGRVMSLHMMEFSLVSFGTFLVGILAAVIGVQLAIGGTAVALLLVTLYCLRYAPRVRDLP